MTEQVLHDQSRAVVRVSGVDASHFLNGLTTNHMPDMGQMVYSGLLTPQGKVMCDFFIAHVEDAFLIDLPRSEAETIIKRLGFYKLRSKVEISLTELHVALSLQGIIANALCSSPDPRHAGLGQRALVTQAPSHTDLSAYHEARIGLGIPLGGVDFAYNDAFSHEANMDLLNGIDFKKGCYVGQEVVSRVHHKSGARKRILPVDLSAEVTAPQEIMLGDVTAGTLTSSAKLRGIALMRLDRAHRAVSENIDLKIGDTHAVPVRPEWFKGAFVGEAEFEGRS